jgi:hypothetical protein
MKYKFLELDKCNKNGRIYTKSEINKVINDVRILSQIQDSRLFVESCMDRSFQRPDIDPENICGVVKGLFIEGDSAYCDITPLQTKAHLFDLIDELNFAIRPKGLGSYEKDGKTIKNYTLVSLAITKDPS